MVACFGPWKIPKCLENGVAWDQKWVKNGSKTHFSKCDHGPLGMLKQLFLPHFELVVTRFGPWKMPKCLEKGPFWDQKWVKNGSKTRFPQQLFTQLHLQSGNAIFRNVFDDTTARAKPHIDFDCFQRNRTFLWHFGPHSYLPWGNSKYPLEHAALYAFDAACTHSVPLMGRYSLSIRSWD